MSLFRRISNLFSRSSVDREIDAELRSHIEMRVEDNVAAGMTSGEARRDAMLRFGNLTKTRERVNAVDALLAVESVFMDTRYAFRQLARSPGFAVATILTISLGVGASTAIFGVVNTVLVRPLSYPHAERIVQTEKVTTTGSSYTASIPLFLYWGDTTGPCGILPRTQFSLLDSTWPGERCRNAYQDFASALISSACSESRFHWGETSPKRTINLGRSASSFLEKASGIADTTMTVRLSANRFGSMESRTQSLEFCRWDFSFLAPCRRQPQLKSGPHSNCRPQAAIHAVYSNASGG
jgi:hypothetical protein